MWIHIKKPLVNSGRAPFNAIFYKIVQVASLVVFLLKMIQWNHVQRIAQLELFLVQCIRYVVFNRFRWVGGKGHADGEARR